MTLLCGGAKCSTQIEIPGVNGWPRAYLSDSDIVCPTCGTENRVEADQDDDGTVFLLVDKSYL